IEDQSVRNYSLQYIKQARNWQRAIYDLDSHVRLGLPPSGEAEAAPTQPGTAQASTDGNQPAAETQPKRADTPAPAPPQPEPAAVEPLAPAGQPEQQEPGASLPDGTKRD
ncbi:MAG TPA: hypothetical protein VFG99_01990, partial [Chloroflexia bacterium]|nr:hypothetical protein [Chloroflexia bacterium]